MVLSVSLAVGPAPIAAAGLSELVGGIFIALGLMTLGLWILSLADHVGRGLPRPWR